MGHIERHLLPNERVVYRARLHRIALVLPSVLAFFFAMGILAVFSVPDDGAGDMRPTMLGGYVIMFGLPALLLFMSFVSTEFAVTNRRVIMKAGWLRRRTVETVLEKVEGVSGEESLLGRALGYGTIIVTGSGGTREAFRRIADHEQFRRVVQEQIPSYERGDRSPIIAPTSSQMAAVTAAPSVALTDREERDCPWCAERILAKARVCKHCGREVGTASV
jgi:hypothetical protein